MDPSNYKPTSLLPFISKILRKLYMAKRLTIYLNITIYTNINPVLEQNIRLILCLSYLITKILKGYDNGFFTGMILIDLQKTFDTIDHDILLEKLKVILVFVTILSIGFIHI